MSLADKIFVTMCQDILENGTSTEGEKVRPHWEDGTSAYTIKKFGVVNRYDLSKEFPAITLRKTAIKTCTEEMLWIWQRKSNNIHDFNSIVDMGGWVKDVFVYHKVYGVIKADLNLHSRRDIKDYMAEIGNGKSNLLMNVTSGYHYHTVIAPDEDTLDIIQEKLDKLGFLARLQEYEPVDFWSSKA